MGDITDDKDTVKYIRERLEKSFRRTIKELNEYSELINIASKAIREHGKALKKAKKKRKRGYHGNC